MATPVPSPRSVPVPDLAPGERIDALVEMSHPGVWILSEPDDAQTRSWLRRRHRVRRGRSGPAQWSALPAFAWDYAAFAGRYARRPEPGARIAIVIEPGQNGNLWALNGKSYPQTYPIRLRNGARNRLSFENRSMMDHPVHLHRHSFELTRLAGKPVSRIVKDVVLVPAHETVEVDVIANRPGPSLFHCHQQFHMDFGFMALMTYNG